MADQNTNDVVDQAGEEAQANYLSMSDEEILAGGEPKVPAAPAAKTEESASESNEEEANDETSDAGATGEDDEPAAKPGEEESAEATEDENKASDAEEEESTEEDKTAKAEDDKDPEKDAEKSDAVDYKAEYERLLAPFKANGRDIQVKSVDDAITLMQMGANYNKKMAALKPNLKLMKLLENNGLLNEEKIGFLIDLTRKDAGAINKLVKDSGIDPMDLDAEKASGYKQSTYTVDDREIELDTVLDDLQGTPTYNRTLEIVSTKWDSASKGVIAQNPALLKVINDHVSAGIYDLISAEIENERTFGRLTGLSDIEAYRQVGDALNAKGAFNHLVQGRPQSQGQSNAPGKVVVPPKPKKVDDDKLKDKKRAASSTKPAVPSSGQAQDFNPLALSDEEFSKLVNKQFL